MIIPLNVKQVMEEQSTESAKADKQMDFTSPYLAKGETFQPFPGLLDQCPF
jgi:hypothetical protein